MQSRRVAGFLFAKYMEERKNCYSLQNLLPMQLLQETLLHKQVYIKEYWKVKACVARLSMP